MGQLTAMVRPSAMLSVCLLSAEEKKKSIPFGRQLTKQSLLSSEAGRLKRGKGWVTHFLAASIGPIWIRVSRVREGARAFEQDK